MLTELQRRVARIVLAASPDTDLALAGGAAAIEAGLIARSTEDLDLFTPHPHVVSILEAATAALDGEGMTVEPLQVTATFCRFRVTYGDEVCLVDVAQDFRLLPAEQRAVGPTVAVDELAADKVLALFSRAYARDFVDVYFLADRLGRERLLELAKAKDPGFDEEVFAAMLATIERFDREEFAAGDVTLDAMRGSFESWRRDLLSAEHSTD